MNNKMKRLVLLTVLTVFACGLSAQVITEKLCCVAGNYNGSHISDPGPNCPVPKSEPFSMTIKQGIGCAANIWGTTTDAAGVVQNFTGTLTRGPRGCCVINGKFGKPGHVTTFTGTLCLKLGKWQAKGTSAETYSGSGCKHTGTWEMKQI
jgi:hypothetical protein